MFDLVIIGGSIAGTTAAIYAVRRKLNFKLVTTELGGEVASSGEIENWPGINKTDGLTLAQQLHTQLQYNQVPVDEGFVVNKLEHKDNHWFINAKSLRGEERVFETKTVIVATGAKPRSLDVPGEKELVQKGVSYCTVCDGPLYKNKIVATVGGGNSALESALMLSAFASKVFVLNRNATFTGEQVLIDKLKQQPNVEIIYQATTTKIEGTERVSGLTYTDASGASQTIAVQGVMVHIGNVPNAEFVPSEKDKFGQIVVDARGSTSLVGLFAAGDVTNVPYKQIVIAAGMGCTAALSAIEYLNRN